MGVRKGSESDDHILIRHYLALWESYGTPETQIQPDARDRIKAFIDEARQHRGLGTFFAYVDDAVAGSVACQLHLAPYPEVVIPTYRCHGYIWSVFVEPQYRGLGVASGLMDEAIKHLKSLGCTTAVLHSSEAGFRLYERLGFKLAKEMRLDL